MMERMVRSVKIGFLLALLFIFPTGCTNQKKPPSYYKRPSVSRPTSEQTSENEAAKSLVVLGIEALKENLIDKAEWNFQEAIQIAPSFGPAYFWLAWIKYKMDNFQKANNLLDKAEILLKTSQKWMEKIEKLRETILEKE